MIGIIANLCAGAFFGAALYINLAQHPATLQVGGAFASKFFPPMYGKASVLQIFLAVLGTLLGVVSWYLSDNILWLIGAVFLVSVVPITIIFIKPINDQLLAPSSDLSDDEVLALLQQWNPKHWVRTIVSGIAFVLYLVALSS